MLALLRHGHELSLLGTVVDPRWLDNIVNALVDDHLQIVRCSAATVDDKSVRLVADHLSVAASVGVDPVLTRSCLSPTIQWAERSQRTI